MEKVDKIIQAIKTTLVIDNKQSMWRCKKKIEKILTEN